MNFEPAVIKRIRSEKRRSTLQSALITLPLLAGIAACLALLVWGIAREQPETGGSPGTMNLTLLALLASIFIALLLIFISAVRRWKKENERIAGAMAYPESPDARSALKTFQDALDAVAVGAGVESPGLLLSDLPTANALPAYKDGRAHVILTRELLDNRLSFREAEALMSCELSRVLLGSVWNAPVFLRSGLVPFVLLGILSVLLVATVLVFVPDRAVYGFLSFVLGLAVIFSLAPVGRRLFKHGDVARIHRGAMADSVAVKITGDPGTLKELIGKMAESMEASDMTRDLVVVSRYLFVCPGGELDETGDAERAGPDKEDASEGIHPGALAKTLEYGTLSVAERIRNLEAIEKGHWPVLGE